MKPPFLNSVASHDAASTIRPSYKVREHVAIHVPCSSKKLGVESTFAKVAALCADKVTPSGIPCCGMVGAVQVDSLSLS